MSSEEKLAAQHSFSTELKESKSNIDTISSDEHSLGLPYPQGCIQWYKNGMILAAGGAGPTKSGLANGFEVLQFIKSKSRKSQSFELKRHSWFNTDRDIVYCIRQHPLYPFQFIAGIGNNLVIMEITSSSKPTENNAFKYDYNNILKIKYPRNDPIIKPPINTIFIKSNIESTPLVHPDDPFCVQRVELSSKGKLLASGGTDGIVRLFKYDFIDPNNALSFIQQINITRQHFMIEGRERNPTQEPPTEIERLLFDSFDNNLGKDSKYLAICNRGFAAYIWNINRKRMETILMENKSRRKQHIFRDCVFLDDENGNRYCIVAVNGIRKSRRSAIMPSYLYQYYIPPDGGDEKEEKEKEWFRINYCKIMKSDVVRMIGDVKTRNIITLHVNGMICIYDGLNLTKKRSFKNEGNFFMDITVSPNLFGDKENGYTEYLLIALMQSLLIKPISLKPCYMKASSGSCGVCCCSCRCLTYFFAIIVVLVAVFIAIVQQDGMP